MRSLSFEHFQPVRLIFGAGERRCIPELLANRRTFLVTGRETLERADCLHLLGKNTRRSTPVPPNPGDQVIDQLLEEARAFGADSVLGFGGGSVLDAAKVVALLLNNWVDLSSFRAQQASKTRQTQLIQVPTTAGTGSEVTRWASVWNDGVKSSVDEFAGFADLALVDPELCHGMPSRLTLATGLDALSHAMESLWGVHRSVLSEGYACRALSLISANLEQACDGQAQAETWESLSLASTLAGLALSCTRSAAAHALSYELTGRFGLDHGLAVGLLSKSLLKWNQPFAPLEIDLIVTAMGKQTPEEVQAFIDRCFRLAGHEPSLAAFGISREDFPAVLSQASASNRLGNNPGHLDGKTLLEVLEFIA